jgi:hypothetical protein
MTLAVSTLIAQPGPGLAFSPDASTLGDGLTRGDILVGRFSGHRSGNGRDRRDRAANENGEGAQRCDKQRSQSSRRRVVRAHENHQRS